MDRDSDFLDFSAPSTNNSNSNNNNSSHNGDNSRNNNIMENNDSEVPDLIKSVQRSTPRTSPVEESPPLSMTVTQQQQGDEGDGGGDCVEFALRDRRDDYREQDSFSESESIDEMKEDAILKELNNHLSKALSEGNHPQWLYEIKEHEDNTWC